MNSFVLKSRQLIGLGRGNYHVFPVEDKISRHSILSDESHRGNAYSFRSSSSCSGINTPSAHSPRARILGDFHSDYQHPVKVTESKDYNEVRDSTNQSRAFPWTRDQQPYALFSSRYSPAALYGARDSDREPFPIYDAASKSFGVAGLGKDLSRGVDESGDTEQLPTDDDGRMPSPLGQLDPATTCVGGIDDYRVHLEETLQGSSGVRSSSSSSLHRSASVVYPWMRKLHSTSGNCFDCLQSFT